jgi:hypothetical protein
MAWVKVPPEHHPAFHAALPNDPRVETKPMFGGIAAKVNGHVFAGLFGRSTMIWLPEPDRADALALPGAAPFDPMGDGRATSQKVMLPERVMANPAELRRWIGRAFAAVVQLPPKVNSPDTKRRAKTHRAAQAPTGKTSLAERPSVNSRSGKRRGGRTANHAVDPRVDAYLDTLPDWQQAVCQRIRNLVHAADPELTETIKRTKLPFFVLQGNVCALQAARDHVNVFLYDGGIVADPDGIITGGHDNQTARTIAIRQGEAINARALVALIRQIVANNRAGGWRTLKKIREGPPTTG